MKKIMISLLLVLLTICLFVGCSSSPKEDEQSISFTYRVGNVYLTLTFNRDGSGNRNGFAEGESISDSFTYSVSQNDGLNVVLNETPSPFYKDMSNTKITSVDELFSLSSIFEDLSKPADKQKHYQVYNKE